MLTRDELHGRIAREGVLLLDGATGSNLLAAGMPRGACAEAWILENPAPLCALQRAYAEAGSRVLYAPTFQAQPAALARAGLAAQTERVNAALVALTRSVSGGALVAGNLTTLAAFIDSADERNFDLLVENYRRQIRGLIDGGADLLAAETLLYPQEAEAILTAAELEGAGAAMYTFTLQPDGALFSGREAAGVLRELERAGAAAVGFNCVAADDAAALTALLRRGVRGPLVCKPNAGNPVIGADGLAHYPMPPERFAACAAQCARLGASVIGGCCGTTRAHISAIRTKIDSL